jgi:hypothetical protein
MSNMVNCINNYSVNNTYEQILLRGRMFLTETLKQIESNYNCLVKLDNKNCYWLIYIELPHNHPFIISKNTWIDKMFLINKNHRTKKNNPNVARCIFVKFNYELGTQNDALEHMELFSKALKKLELEYGN